MLQSLGITGYAPTCVYTVTQEGDQHDHSDDHNEHCDHCDQCWEQANHTSWHDSPLLYNGESFQYFELRAQLM